MNATRAVSLPSTAAPGSLPPSGERLLAVYRLAWWGLAASALAVLASLLLDPSIDPAILGLRLVKGGILIAVSAILFRRRRTDAVAAMLSLAFLLWTITSSFDFSRAETWTDALDRLRFLLFALALLLFPTGEWRPAWARKVALASVATFLIGMGEILGTLSTATFLPLAIGCVLAALAALLLRYRALAENTEKQQLKWVAFGLVTGIALILSARAGAVVSPPISPLILEGLFQSGIVVLALGFLISLLRYRLYDAEAVISRSAAYAVLTLSLVATFAASEATIEMLGLRWFGPNVGNVSGAMAAAIAAVLLTPLHSRISGWAERRFQQDLILLKEQLPELLAELSASALPGRVGLAALPRIEEAIHASGSALLIDGRMVAANGLAQRDVRRWLRGWTPPDSGQLIDCDDDRTFPLRMALHCPFGNVRGWLLLGPRPDNSFYGKDEIDALKVIAPPLRQALFAAREREKEKARERRFRTACEEAIASLSRRLDAVERNF